MPTMKPNTAIPQPEPLIDAPFALGHPALSHSDEHEYHGGICPRHHVAASVLILCLQQSANSESSPFDLARGRITNFEIALW